MFSKNYIKFLSQNGKNDFRYILVNTIIWVPIVCFAAACLLSYVEFWKSGIKILYQYLLVVSLPSFFGTSKGIVLDYKKYKSSRERNRSDEESLALINDKKRNENIIYSEYIKFLNSNGVLENNKKSNGGIIHDNAYYGFWLYNNNLEEFKKGYEK